VHSRARGGQGEVIASSPQERSQLRICRRSGEVGTHVHGCDGSGPDAWWDLSVRERPGRGAGSVGGGGSRGFRRRGLGNRSSVRTRLAAVDAGDVAARQGREEQHAGPLPCGSLLEAPRRGHARKAIPEGCSSSRPAREADGASRCTRTGGRNPSALAPGSPGPSLAGEPDMPPTDARDHSHFSPCGDRCLEEKMFGADGCCGSCTLG